MSNVKYYSPIRLTYGVLVVISSLLKKAISTFKFAKKSSTLQELETDGFYVEPAVVGSDNFHDIATINNGFAKTQHLKSVVDGAFCDWTGQSSTHYLEPGSSEKQSLVNLLNKSKIISKLSAHHGFEFYCSKANIFKTEASEDWGSPSTNLHRDGHPPYTYKFMIYLTDVANGNGAFAIIPKSVQKLIIPTFGSYSYDRHFSEKDYAEFSLYGNAGTKILFNNNGLHAGGRTVTGDRVVVTYILKPRFSSSCDSSLEAIDWAVGGREYSIF